MSDVSDDVLLPLRKRLRDWQDHDVAGFFLGKALGVIPLEHSWAMAKGLFWGGDEDGLKLMDVLNFLVDQGFLEQRDVPEYGTLRWRTDPAEEPLPS